MRTLDQKCQHHLVLGRNANKLSCPTPDLWIWHSGRWGSVFWLSRHRTTSLDSEQSDGPGLKNQSHHLLTVSAELLTLSEPTHVFLIKLKYNTLFRDVLRMKWSYRLWSKTTVPVTVRMHKTITLTFLVQRKTSLIQSLTLVSWDMRQMWWPAWQKP